MYQLVVGQSYQVNVHDEYVLLGNAALLRCLVPSFVSDYVIVDAWHSDTDDVITPNHRHGIYLPPSAPLFRHQSVLVTWDGFHSGRKGLVRRVSAT